MRKLFGVCAVLIAMISPVLAQDEDHHRDDDRRQEQRRILSPDDQRKFDSYYSRWLEYRRDRNHEQVESMEKRMRHVMERNHISPDTPFDVVASNGDRDRDHDRDDRH